MSHIQGNDNVWCSWVEERVHKWNSKVMTKEEIKLKMATTRYVHKVYEGVQVDV